MRYRVSHTTHYHYAEPVDLAHHMLHLRPRASRRQVVHEATIVAHPSPSSTSEHADHFGNQVTTLVIEAPHREFTVDMNALVTVAPGGLPVLSDSPRWASVRGALQAAQLGTPMPPDAVTTERAVAVQAAEFALPTVGASLDDAARAELKALILPAFAPDRPILDAARSLTAEIARGFAFDPTATTVSTPLSTVLQKRRGVCQDFAHVMIAGLRAIGLAARYVSGYIRTYPREGYADLRGADASHAWVSVWCGPQGWIDFDPTNDLLVEDEHITTAWGRDYSDVSPVRGVVLGGGWHTLDVAVKTEPLGV